MVTVKGGKPDPDILDALDAAADALEADVAYAHVGRYHFPLGGGWSIALSSDSAERIRVELCCLCRPESRMWVLARNLDRLAGLVERMSRDIRETV